MPLASDINTWLRRRGFPLRPFQRDWISGAWHPTVDTAALSLPRGNGKTYLAAHLAAAGIQPDSPIFESGIETLSVSGSLEQSRVLTGFVKKAVEDEINDYRFLDSGQRLAVTHKPTGTKLRILSSDSKRAFGLSDFGVIYADEPGAWQERGGQLMRSALETSLGKRTGQRIFFLGTRAPASSGSWWPELLDGGSEEGTHVEVLTADPDEPWDTWETIKRVNPLITTHSPLRVRVMRERNKARRTPGKRKEFEAFRLNMSRDVTREVLLEHEDWLKLAAREVPPRKGRPILALDLGESRSWSAAFAIWRNGRCEVWALCPGVPNLEKREKADAVPKGLYTGLERAGVLLVDEGFRVARPEVLIAHVRDKGINPLGIIADRFLAEKLQDIVAGRWPVVFRRTRWSESTFDIAAFRQMALDGPLAIAEESRPLIRMALNQAVVITDGQGSSHLEKSRSRRSRDDVAVAAVLSAGALARELGKPRRRWRSRGSP